MQRNRHPPGGGVAGHVASAAAPAALAGGSVPPIKRLIVGGLAMTVLLALCSFAMIQNYVLAQQRLLSVAGGQRLPQQPQQQSRNGIDPVPPHRRPVEQPVSVLSYIRVNAGLYADIEARVTNLMKLPLIPFPNGDCSSLEVLGDYGKQARAAAGSGFKATTRRWATAALFADREAKHRHSFVLCNAASVDSATASRREEDLLRRVGRLNLGQTLREDYAEALDAANSAIDVSIVDQQTSLADATARCNVRLVWLPEAAGSNRSVLGRRRRGVLDRTLNRHRTADAMDESYKLCVEGTGDERRSTVQGPQVGRIDDDDVLLTIAVVRPIGILHAMRTFFQMSMGLAIEGSPDLDAASPQRPTPLRRVRGCISDAPKVPWRGLHLDTSRHFHDVATIKEVLRGMSRLKMNRFHWHLSDDQGWRLESRVFPGLHTHGSTRGDPLNGKKANKYRGMPYPHPTYHTQDEVRGIVAYALQRGIIVVPEVDLPAHAAALIAGLAAGGSEASRHFGGRVDAAQGNIDCNTEDAQARRGAPNCMGGTFGVMFPTQAAVSIATSILGEVCGLFSASPYIHLGGDEAEMIRDAVWGKQTAPRCDLKGCNGAGRSDGATPQSADDFGYVQAMLMDALIAAVENTTVCPAAQYGSVDWYGAAAADSTTGDGHPNRTNLSDASTQQRQAVVWDETILELVKGRVPASPHTLGMLWRDDRASIRDVESQYGQAAGGAGPIADRQRLILTPKTRLYFDYLQHSPVSANRFWPLQRPAPWVKAYKAVTLERSFMTHAMLPVQDWTSSIVYGVQGCLWTELIPNATVLTYQLYPRIYALADAGWSLRHEKDLAKGFEWLRGKIQQIDAPFVRARAHH